jgi:SAM-dependent methyltransferase
MLSQRVALVTMPLVAEHWDQAYTERGAAGVSWYEPSARVSLELVAELGVPVDSAVVDVGGGASALAAALVARGYQDVTVLDVSAVAITNAQEHSPGSVKWLHQDVLNWHPERRYGLWHDRAVLHFFTAKAERQAYRRTLDAAVAVGGHVVLGTFAPDGPNQCSGLPVRRYGAQDLRAYLGDEYFCVTERRDDHVTPSAAIQPFTWAEFKRREYPSR